MAKSIAALAVFLCVLGTKAPACDACGCSVSGAGAGLLGNFRQNFVGLQYHFAPFASTLGHGGYDYFHTAELSVRYRLAKRLNLQLHQPLRFNVRQHPDGNDTRSGLGDTRLLGNFILLNQLSLGKKMKLYAEAGAGVKAPTGHFDGRIRDENLPENFNPGNGSWALLLQSNLVLSYQNAGLAFTVMHQRNGASSTDYRFGNQLTTQLFLYYQTWPFAFVQLTPFAGVFAERVERDVNPNGKFAPGTGGSGYFAAAGFNLKLDNWLLGASWSQPFQQSYSSSEVDAKGRLSVQLSHIF